MSLTSFRITLVACLVISACQSNTAGFMQAALLLNPGPDVTQEIREAVTDFTSFSSVQLSERDLTHSSVLVVERQRRMDDKGDVLQGRDLEMPFRFQLVTYEGRCWLMQLPSGQRHWLQKAQCKST